MSEYIKYTNSRHVFYAWRYENKMKMISLVTHHIDSFCKINENDVKIIYTLFYIYYCWNYSGLRIKGSHVEWLIGSIILT